MMMIVDAKRAQAISFDEMADRVSRRSALEIGVNIKCQHEEIFDKDAQYLD